MDRLDARMHQLLRDHRRATAPAPARLSAAHARLQASVAAQAGGLLAGPSGALRGLGLFLSGALLVLPLLSPVRASPPGDGTMRIPVSGAEPVAPICADASIEAEPAPPRGPPPALLPAKTPAAMPSRPVEDTAQRTSKRAAPVTVHRARAPAHRPTEAAQASAGGIDAELALIAAARLALNRGDAKQAQRSLDAHARRFPDGLFARERTVLSAEALCKLGRRAQARRRAERFVAHNPAHALAARARSICASEKTTADPMDPGVSEQ